MPSAWLVVWADATRLVENAFVVREREDGYADVPVRTIVREMMDCFDGCAMSGKKDVLVNIGGFLAMCDEHVLQQARTWSRSSTPRSRSPPTCIWTPAATARRSWSWCG